jgi:hypothetical protein
VLKRSPAASQRINGAWGTAYNERAWKLFLDLPKDKPLEGLPEAEAVLRLARKGADFAPGNPLILDTRGAILPNPTVGSVAK